MIYIVCALQCEAKPIVEKYKLSLIPDKPFRIFQGKEMRVLVSGIGKIATATAMAYLYALDGEQKNATWLNMGVAGHQSLESGSLFNINKVTEDTTGVNWYPARFPSLAMSSHHVLTVETASEDYPSDALYDMEASAFMLTALRFSPVDLVQLLKIVSDNLENPAMTINKVFVEKLIYRNIDQIMTVIDTLETVSSEYANYYGIDELYNELVTQWHFTQYQKKQLQRLVQKTTALNLSLSCCNFEKMKNGKEIIRYLNETITTAPVEY
ncbi:hypothetical protein MNBD_GAMMA16-1781 [hydrothermal vent metagenome]|uniref:Nucleoside phosphorylase domain-containing protein n=1 Tax=hydrothermal vent metagenome TaxID=652676 RepID=A0A3B0YX24_9ZZZZ